jgi:hypothetical protein
METLNITPTLGCEAWMSVKEKEESGVGVRNLGGAY